MEKLKKAEEKEHKIDAKLERLFRKVLPPLLDNKVAGWGFLVGLFVVFFAVCAMFYTTAVTVKMLPYDNKSEFAIVIDMPEGTALPATANLARELAERLRAIPEVTAVQTYAGTARPFDFNGMVRHYYIRKEPWHGEVQVQLLNKKQRDRSSHQIAEEARALLTPIARSQGARITVAEPPPGPPVLQSVVAEIYGPDAATRRQVAGDMTDLPVPTPDGRTLPLGELGRFVRADEDSVIYHKDLRPLEYVVGDAVGRLGAPIYPMLTVDDRLYRVGRYYRA